MNILHVHFIKSTCRQKQHNIYTYSGICIIQHHWDIRNVSDYVIQFALDYAERDKNKDYKYLQDYTGVGLLDSTVCVLLEP